MDDDLLLNTAGAVLGYLLFSICNDKEMEVWQNAIDINLSWRKKPRVDGRLCGWLQFPGCFVSGCSADIICTCRKAGIYIGVLGLTGIMMAAAGFVTGLGSFKEKHKNHRSSTAGSLINGVLAVLWLALFLIGVS